MAAFNIWWLAGIAVLIYLYFRAPTDNLLVKRASWIALAIICIYALYQVFQSFQSKGTSLKSEMTDATVSTTIQATSLPDAPSGLEATNFAYSIWIYIDDWTYLASSDRYILIRTANLDSSTREVAPYIYLPKGGQNNIHVSVTCADPNSNNTMNNTIIIPNVPIQKWCMLTVSVNDMVLDGYLDGKLVTSYLMSGLAKVDSQANLMITPNGGFKGYTSKVRYFNHALNPTEVWNMYSEGFSQWSSFFSSYGLQVAITNNGQSNTILSI